MDEKVYALVQGDRGLYYTDGKRIYFPDRKWTEAKAGFFTDMYVSVDKGSYAFIRGRMLNTTPIDKEAFFNFKPFELSSNYFTNSLGDTHMVVERFENGSVSIYVNTSDGLKEVVHAEDYMQGYISGTRQEYHYNQFISILLRDKEPIDVSGYVIDYYEQHCKLDKDRFLEACIRLKSNALSRKVESIKLYDDVFIVTDYVIEYTGVRDRYRFTNIYAYGNDLYKIENLDVKKLGKVTNEISDAELEDFCVKNHICLGYGNIANGAGTLLSRDFISLGVEDTVYAWNGNKFKMNFLEDTETVAEIEESFVKLQSDIKRVGKSCTGRMINELQKLNPKPWILHK